MGAGSRKLRSSTVVLGGMGLLAVTLSACGSEPDKRCVDPTSRKQLPSYECKSGGGSSTSGKGGSGSYYYGGSSKNGKVEGGSFDKSSVSRGGFGCSSSSGG
ncbi:hypothetical protein RCO28_17310 [Streptomyces sp. LHD-70]|uniref:hypothetical protein n=1 Tax=Streptomyces sp. LHD-70 TaxID=3072140 RepID=UPI00280D5F93|nr:hypothetical protein [Streptomyces sp. LHD-70]MDQ8704233.1 hypothetical protein [Streptomyces sp. LHD-70]